MIDWKMLIIEGNEERWYDLNTAIKWVINETVLVQFIVTVSEDLYSWGNPYILIGDMPLELTLTPHIERDRLFKSKEMNDRNVTQLFLNLFGENEIELHFNRHEHFCKTVVIDVQARRANALFVKSMLEYLTSRIQDISHLCFSVSRIKDYYSANDQAQWLKLTLLSQIINDLNQQRHLFKFIHRHSWYSCLSESETGRPIGTESLYWAATHLDEIVPSSAESANCRVYNRAYHFNTLPAENIAENTDLFENRVIHSFLIAAKLFLKGCKTALEAQLMMTIKEENYENEFINFHDVLTNFKLPVIQHKLSEVIDLIKNVEYLKAFFNQIIPVTSTMHLLPRLTHYVRYHQHYLNLFILMDKWYQAHMPKVFSAQLLMGLKNLTKLYEFTCLLMLLEVIQEQLYFKLIYFSYRKQGELYPFGGIEAYRPDGAINNYFVFQRLDQQIELYFEPQIYPYSYHSVVGDLIDVSSSNYKAEHYYCPDFVLKITATDWTLPAIIIFDAKYSNSKNVKDYYIPQLIKKYLLGINQLQAGHCLGPSPIQLVMALFAHDTFSRTITTVHRRHLLKSDLPVLPQVAGQLFVPGDTYEVGECIDAVIRITAERYLTAISPANPPCF